MKSGRLRQPRGIIRLQATELIKLAELKWGELRKCCVPDVAELNSSEGGEGKHAAP